MKQVNLQFKEGQFAEHCSAGKICSNEIGVVDFVFLFIHSSPVEYDLKE
jgi:hypothetical protein